METIKHTITWFEIPTAQLGRALDFYARLTGHALTVTTSDAMEMVVFPGPDDAVRGCLVRDERHQPGKGTLVYLAAQDFPGGLDGALQRVSEAGGKVVLGRTAIGPHGWIGLFEDTEGNVVGLHVP